MFEGDEYDQKTTQSIFCLFLFKFLHCVFFTEESADPECFSDRRLRIIICRIQYFPAMENEIVHARGSSDGRARTDYYRSSRFLRGCLLFDLYSAEI